MSRGGVHHIDLTVTSLAASKPFYQAVLGFMGYVIAEERDEIIDFRLQTPGGGPSFIGILPAKRDTPHDRYAPGLHHLAWTAASRADVDAFHARLQDIGATVLDAPAEYPQYSPGYYAVFFADPDGLKLEYVHKP